MTGFTIGKLASFGVGTIIDDGCKWQNYEGAELYGIGLQHIILPLIILLTTSNTLATLS